MITDYKIIIPSSEEELRLYYDLRYEVLRKPWGQNPGTTKDEWEDQSLHVLVTNMTGKAIATGRLQFNSDTEGQIRSMAVAKEYRGKGIGSIVLKYLEEEAKNKNLTQIVLDSRDNAVNFYLKNDYSIEGDSYVLFGVIPHFRMAKKLAD